MHPCGHVVDPDVPVEVLDEPVEHLGESRGTAHRDRRLDELALTAVAMRRNHHASRDQIGCLVPDFFADEMQRGVDARRGAGAGGDRAVVDEQYVGVDAGPGYMRASFSP